MCVSVEGSVARVVGPDASGWVCRSLELLHSFGITSVEERLAK